MGDEREFSSSLMANNFVTGASSSAVPWCDAREALAMWNFLKMKLLMWRVEFLLTRFKLLWMVRSKI